MPYLTPGTVEEAVSQLNDSGAAIVSGGTDFFPALQDRPAPSDILDLSRVAGMRGIALKGASWRIGAATTWTDILRADLPPAFDGLKLAAREVGSVQIQNAGTVGGNLCNASPAADGVPPLLTLDAEVELAGPSGQRRMPLAAFLTGVRQTARQPGEVMTALHIPAQPDGARSHFLKLGSRAYLVISIAMVAVLVRADAGRIAEARLAVGACSPVAQRLPVLEAALKGRASADLSDPALWREENLTPLAPIEDIRGSAAYRWQAAAALLRRAVQAALEPTHG